MKNVLGILLMVLCFSKALCLTCYHETLHMNSVILNGSCGGSRLSHCFTSVEIMFDSEGKPFQEVRRYGCFHSSFSSSMQCRSYFGSSKTINVSCCNDVDFCNQHLSPHVIVSSSLFERRAPESESSPGTPSETDPDTLIICLTVLALIVFFIVLWSIKKPLRTWRFGIYRKSKCEKFDSEIQDGNDSFGELSSGSGSGTAKLVRSTVGKRVEQIRIIGKGRFGKVLLARWNGELVAVKVFSTTEEESWLKEKSIYQSLCGDNNILGFIAADILALNCHTEMLLITQFHELGSLYDYLQLHSVNQRMVLQMGYSMISGLSYLHTEIIGTIGKPAIAHRDFKSKNVLVKNERGDCCIADFGLSLLYFSEEGMREPVRTHVGTTRYLAPEVLDETINKEWIDAFKCADIYSFSLVLWEACNRCVVTAEDGSTMSGNSYELPYYEYVQTDPSLEEMRDVVCLKQARPNLEESWSDDSVLHNISDILIESWYENPSARLNALRIKKKLSTYIKHSK